MPARIKDYFDRFREVSIPEKEKVTIKWLRALNFTSSNDTYILRVIKHIGFIDDSGNPTDYWKQYKIPTKSRAVLAQAIRQGYHELFEMYPDAQRKDREALYAFFMSKTDKAKATVDLMVSTFVNLCELADFETEPAKIKIPLPAEPELYGKPTPIATVTSKPEKGIISEIHIDIQLHLPATTDPAIYENLFKSLRKHLLSEEE